MAQAAPKQTRTNRRRAKSFESLVQAGLTVIGQRGLYETTVAHITEAADVGKGTFYAHFASKEDLVFHLVHHGFDELIATRTPEPPISGARAPAVRLAALIQGQLRALGRRRDLIVLLHQVRGLLILQPEACQRLRQEYRRYVQFLMGECQRALGSPPLGQAQLRDLACAIAGFVAGALSFEILVRESRGAVPTLMRPVNAFAAGIVARYLRSPSRVTGT